MHMSMTKPQSLLRIEFNPKPQELTLYRHDGKKYVTVEADAASRYVVPDLGLEMALVNGSVRVWYTGEPLPQAMESRSLLKEMRREFKQTQQQLREAQRQLKQAQREKEELFAEMRELG